MSTTPIELRDPAGPIPLDARTAETPRYLALVGLVFVLLMVALEPDVGFAAPPAARLLFWTLQVGSGLIVLQSALHLLTRFRGASRLPNGFWVLLSGVLGAAVLAPIYWLIGDGLMQGWLGYPALPDEDSSDWIGIATSNPLLGEFLDIVGPVSLAWTLICLPRLHSQTPPLLGGQAPSAMAATPGAALEPRATVEPASPRATFEPASPPATFEPASPPATFEPASPPATSEAASPRATWRERLPAELGDNVIAVASELQYLRVWTTRGCALILGALADVESEDVSHGVRVHRSWWVAAEHVASVRRTASGVVCLMSDGRQVPVSRRRSAEVLARFGNGARYRLPGSSETVAKADLN